MFHRQLAFLVTVGLFAVATACNRSADTDTKQTETTIETSKGTVKIADESKKVGTTLEAKSETKADTPNGVVETKTEEIIGTVTAFAGGKKIEVITGEKKMHTFSLDDKDIAYSVDANVSVGKRVTVIDETGADKVRHITVRLGA